MLVAEGDYTESVTAEDGVNLYAGFDEDFEVRDADEYPVVIEGLAGEPALAQGLLMEKSLCVGLDGLEPKRGMRRQWVAGGALWTCART